jgi:hypothetical protein
MAEEQERRVHDAIVALVEQFLPSIPDEDEHIEEQRIDDAVDLARSILDR